jgi:hypothetical protein
VGDYPVEEFLRGAAAGVVAVGVALALAAATGRGRPGHGLTRVVGLPLAAGGFAAICLTRTPTAGMVIGLAGVTASAAMTAALLSAGRRMPAAVAFLLTIPFAWLLAVDASSVGWVRAVVVGAAAVGPVAATATDADWGSMGVTPILFAVSSAGVFAAVPNTREAAALLGASVPAALAGWPLGRARLGRVGAACATVLLVWVAAIGSLGREPAVVGAIACLGLLATLSAGRGLAASWRSRRRPGPRSGLVVGPLPTIVVHMAVVAVASRVAGISSTLRVAVPIAATTVLVALALSLVLVGRPAPADASRGARRRS